MQNNLHSVCAAKDLRKKSDEELAKLYKLEEEREHADADALRNEPSSAEQEAALLQTNAELGGVEAVLRQQRVGLQERLRQAELRAQLYEGSFEVERMRVASLQIELCEQKDKVYALVPSASDTLL